MSKMLWGAGVFFLAATAHTACPVAVVNKPTAAANKLVVAKIGEFFKCDPQDPTNDKSPCNTFASRSLEAVYGVTDFKLPNGAHMPANVMFDKVAASAAWVKLGPVFDEQNNLCAQSIANSGWPIIAIMKAQGHGHVALVIPGEPAKAGASWGNILAANSANFRLDMPDKAYINQPLSFAFGKENAQKALFYYRKP